MINAYRKMLRKAKTIDETSEILQNLILELVAKVSSAGDKSNDEALAIMQNADSDYRKLCDFSRFNIDKDGFRSIVLSGFDHAHTEIIFRHFGWDIIKARLSEEPWLTITER